MGTWPRAHHSQVHCELCAFREAMGREGVLINGGYAGYPTYIRVSMGKLEDLEVFDRVFKRVIARA